MIVIEIMAIIAFFIFLAGAGIGIFFMCIDGTEVGRAIDEKIAKLIRGRDNETD